jgi:YgiT-type zinc finger domain-containing protein
VDIPDGTEPFPMKCSIQGCPGELEGRAITHTVRHKGRLVVIDHVPAEVCRVCGELLLAPEAVRRIQEILETQPNPSRSVPLYEYV